VEVLDQGVVWEELSAEGGMEVFFVSLQDTFGKSWGAWDFHWRGGFESRVDKGIARKLGEAVRVCGRAEGHSWFLDYIVRTLSRKVGGRRQRM